MINLPLLAGEQCLGTLNIGSAQMGHPDAEDLEFLGQVATQIAFAIDHVQAYEQINRLREELARENEYLVEEIKLTHNFGEMVGKSPELQQVLSACAGGRADIERRLDYRRDRNRQRIAGSGDSRTESASPESLSYG